MSGVSMTSGVADLLGPRAAQTEALAKRKAAAEKASASRETPVDEGPVASHAKALRRADVSRPSARVNALTPEAKATLRRVDAAAQGFEQIFVKKLLESAHFGPEGQHGSMGIDALARGVTSGGGLGLGHMIRDTLLASEHPELASAMRRGSVASPLQRPGVTEDGSPVAEAQEKDA